MNAVENWWLLLIKGLLFIFIGLWILFSPIEGLVALGVYIGLIYFLSGILSSLFALLNREVYPNWRGLVVMGLLNMLCGGILLVYPEITPIVITFCVGFWAIIYGFFVGIFSLEQRISDRSGWGWSLFWGILTILFGFFILRHPLIVGVSLMFFLGIVLLTGGFFNIFLAFKFKRLKKKISI